MAVDSRQKRTSMISSGRRLPWLRRFTLPVPESSIETPDRAQLASIYSGLISSSTPAPSTGGGGGMLMMGVGGGGGFNPLSLNPTLLLDPANSYSDAGSTLAVDNDPVYQVNDSSDNGDNVIQTSLASRPLLDAVNALINNRPALVFDGSNDDLSNSGFSISGATRLTTFTVAKRNVTTNIVAYGGGNNGAITQLQFLDATTLAAYAGTSIYGSGPISGSDWGIFVVDYDGGQTGNANRLKVYVNGGSNIISGFFGTVPASLSGTGITLGATTGGAGRYNGHLSYFIMLEDLSVSQINQLGNYLATRFGLSWTDI